MNPIPYKPGDHVRIKSLSGDKWEKIDEPPREWIQKELK